MISRTSAGPWETSGWAIRSQWTTDFAIWRAFGNRYWPALYLIDAVSRCGGGGLRVHFRLGLSDTQCAASAAGLWALQGCQTYRVVNRRRQSPDRRRCRLGVLRPARGLPGGFSLGRIGEARTGLRWVKSGCILWIGCQSAAPTRSQGRVRVGEAACSPLRVAFRSPLTRPLRAISRRRG